jgi:hypothetical protein
MHCRVAGQRLGQLNNVLHLLTANSRSANSR